MYFLGVEAHSRGQQHDYHKHYRSANSSVGTENGPEGNAVGPYHASLQRHLEFVRSFVNVCTKLWEFKGNPFYVERIMEVLKRTMTKVVITPNVPPMEPMRISA